MAGTETLHVPLRLRLRRRLILLSTAVLLACLNSPAHALVFGMAGKSADVNFVAAWQGCATEAKRSGDECVFLATGSGGHARVQSRLLAEALKLRHFDGLAISVTHPSLVGMAIADASFPIVTFDSPFIAPYAGRALQHVGNDDIALGRTLGRLARQRRAGGGSICLMTAAHDPNLARRMLGVRRELSGDASFPDGRRLRGEGGWSEPPRCPWNTADISARAMLQLRFTLQTIKPDVFLSVGHWPVADIAAYRQIALPLRRSLEQKRPYMITALGRVTARHKALMDEKLLHAYVSLDFHEIGRQTYRQLRAAALHETAHPVLLPLPLVIVDGDGSRHP